jgi:hypothetical protein
MYASSGKCHRHSRQSGKHSQFQVFHKWLRRKVSSTILCIPLHTIKAFATKCRNWGVRCRTFSGFYSFPPLRTRKRHTVSAYESASLLSLISPAVATHEIGANLVSAGTAVPATVFAPDAATIILTVIAAEQIQNNTLILYFLEGSDRINVHIEASTIARSKQHADRIARRTRALFEDPTVKRTIRAVIYARNLKGFDSPIIDGSRNAPWSRFWDAFTERWPTRVATPAIVFFLAAAYLPATMFFQAAFLGFLAAAITLIIESILFAMKAGEWKWEENKSEG